LEAKERWRAWFMQAIPDVDRYFLFGLDQYKIKATNAASLMQDQPANDVKFYRDVLSDRAE
jgi:hypothetical protein